MASSDRTTAGIDYELFLDCVHCGLCTSACPTYFQLGDETHSPRGRIYLMRALTDGRIELDNQVRRHLDLCLDCRACESACPSGVQYGKLIEPFRIHQAKQPSAPASLGWLHRLLLFGITAHARRTRWALAPMRFLQRTGIDRLLQRTGLARLIPSRLRQVQDMIPPLEPHYGELPEILRAIGPRRARVALFTGCAADAFFPQTNLNTARVLQHNGCDVWVPRRQVCCGALHYHCGMDRPAQRLAARNLAVFEKRQFEAEPLDAIIVNASGCGAMLKDYGHLLANTKYAHAGLTLAAKVRDISEFLVELGPIRPEHPLRVRAVYHDACHLCHAQQIRKQPRQLLEMIPGLELISLNEGELCCGAAGSYNLTEPEMAERLGLRKARNILATGAQAVLAGNVGCLIQIGRYLRHEHPELIVAHPVDMLWASYCGNQWPARKNQR